MNWIDEKAHAFDKKYRSMCVGNGHLNAFFTEYFRTELKEAHQRGVEEGSKCRVCGGTDVVCAQGVADQIKKAVEEERKRCEQQHEKDL